VDTPARVESQVRELVGEQALARPWKSCEEHQAMDGQGPQPARELAIGPYDEARCSSIRRQSSAVALRTSARSAS
jgi:hypothetical protein